MAVIVVTFESVTFRLHGVDEIDVRNAQELIGSKLRGLLDDGADDVQQQQQQQHQQQQQQPEGQDDAKADPGADTTAAADAAAPAPAPPPPPPPTIKPPPPSEMPPPSPVPHNPRLAFATLHIITAAAAAFGVPYALWFASLSDPTGIGNGGIVIIMQPLLQVVLLRAATYASWAGVARERWSSAKDAHLAMACRCSPLPLALTQ